MIFSISIHLSYSINSCANKNLPRPALAGDTAEVSPQSNASPESHAGMQYLAGMCFATLACTLAAMRCPCKWHEMGCLWLLPLKPNTGGEYWYDKASYKLSKFPLDNISNCEQRPAVGVAQQQLAIWRQHVQSQEFRGPPLKPLLWHWLRMTMENTFHHNHQWWRAWSDIDDNISLHQCVI